MESKKLKINGFGEEIEVIAIINPVSYTDIYYSHKNYDDLENNLDDLKKIKNTNNNLSKLIDCIKLILENDPNYFYSNFDKSINLIDIPFYQKIKEEA